jgi:hypothetical protein
VDPEERADLGTPAWERARRALRAGDTTAAEAHLDEAVERWRSLQDYSINWITSLLSFVGRELGEEAVERALRTTGDEYVRPRRSGGPDWSSLPAEVRAKVIARAMVANFGSCEVTEDDEKIVLSFRCGTGGRLIDEGRYEDPEASDERPGYLVLREPAGRTFGRDRLPVYCAHCSVNNEMQAIEWDGLPTTVEFPPERPGEPCVHHIYRDPAAIPGEVYVRLDKAPPTSPGS